MRLLLLIVLFLPGFLITLVIGLARSRGRVRLARLLLISTGCGLGGAALLVGTLAALFWYGTRTLIVDHSQPLLTVAQARAANCPILLPDAATHVQFEQASGGLVSLEILVRFEAPESLCRAEAQAVADFWNKQAGLSTDKVSFTPLDRAPKAEDGDMVGRAPWFDAEKIDRGVMATSHNVQCWIDQDRGVFFCKITD